MKFDTERLYYQSAYMKEFDATVLSCSAFGSDGSLFAIVLDRTAFFPESGGQYGDSGTLDGIEVRDTILSDGAILHITEMPIDSGTEVHGVIDFEMRFLRMQNHTGEHIVSGIIHRMLGLENIGFHLSDEDVTLDTNGAITVEQLDEIERLANRAVWANVPVTVCYATRDEQESSNFRGRLERVDSDESIRVVDINGVDRCACCAPHVAHTGEIGAIKIKEAIKYKGGMRLTLLCGQLALSDHSARQAREARLSSLLSLPPERLCEGCERLLAECAGLKSEISALNARLCDGLANTIAQGCENACIFTELDTTNARRLVNLGMQKCKGICAVFCGDDGMGYSFIMGSENVDMREFSKLLLSKLSGRGGGSTKMIQGSLRASRKCIEALFDELRDQSYNVTE